LYFLDLFDQEEFRLAVANNEVITFIHQKQYFHWQYHANFMSRAFELEAQSQDGEGTVKNEVKKE
jgi:hypothetical protein